MKKVAVVTGSERGIGQATTLLLAKKGWEVIEADKNAISPIDVSVDTEVTSLFNSAVNAYDRLDLLVNNAGIHAESVLGQTRLRDWEDIMRTNLTSTFLCCRAALPIMFSQRKGTIINVSSIVIRRAGAISAAYMASKAGVEALTKSIVRDYTKFGIQAFTLLPGYIETPMWQEVAQRISTNPDELEKQVSASIPLGRLGKPEEVAKVILFLASPAASYMNGNSIEIDGGYHCF